MVQQEGWGSCCPWGPVWSSVRRVGPVVQSRAGSVLGELQPVGSPHGISSGGTVGGTHMERRQSDHGGAAETKRYVWTDCSLHLHQLGKGDRRKWMKEMFLICFQFLTPLVC